MTQPTNPALEAAAARLAQRRALQLRLHKLQLEETIAAAQQRVAFARTRLGEAEQRLTDLERLHGELVATESADEPAPVDEVQP